MVFFYMAIKALEKKIPIYYHFRCLRVIRVLYLIGKKIPIGAIMKEKPNLNEVDLLVSNGQEALRKFMEMDQASVDKIVYEMTKAGLEAHLDLAKLAFNETGRGVVEDKVIKNMFATEYIYHSIKREKTVGIVERNELE